MLPRILDNLLYPDLDLIFVEGGSFYMGADKANDPDAFDDEGPPHLVKLQPFYMAQYPVTQRLWAAVMGADDKGAEPSYFQGPLRPKTDVSWEDAKAFLNVLNADKRLLEGLLKGWEFKLPSEAEWEYAARGGLDSRGFKYAGSAKLKEVGWYDENSHGETKPVGLKFPNELGLHDMSGNVWEWCEDDWHSNYNDAPDDGRPWVDSPKRGGHRVYRGGSYFYGPQFCRSSYRSSHSPGSRSSDLGFRLAFSPR